ncbi:phytoene desaturase family protein [Paenibacillus sp. CN-4]|uniref:phytoene desaturase family protein n=1 Tax=Paenibacillus nanchangensis TaxID=3348343 RepID=UPI00397811C2
MSRVAVIGGGIGGLTAALLLSRQGQEVTLYEQESKVGGRTAFEEEGPFRIDKGPTIVLLPEMLLGILEEAGIPAERVPLLRCDPLYRIHFRSGRTLIKTGGAEETAAEIERTYPGEGAGLLRFMRDMAHLYPQGKRSFLERDFGRNRDFFTPSNLRLMLRLQAYRSLRSAVGRYFRSEELRDAFSLQSLYIGGAPFQTPGIYTMLPYAELAFGVWMLKGGYGRLPELMAEELVRRGVKIHTETAIESLLIQGRRCRGVVVRGAAEEYDAVLYNGDYPNLDELLAGGTGRKKAETDEPDSKQGAPRRRMSSSAGIVAPGWTGSRGSGGRTGGPVRVRRDYLPSSGCVLLYIGVEKRWEKSLTHQFFLPDSLDRSLKSVFKERRIPADPSYYVFNPAVLDPEAAPPGASVLYFLIPVPDAHGIDWAAESGPLVERVLEDAERRGFPGLRDRIVWRKIRTPEDAQREGLYGGGSFGIAPVLSQSGVFRPQPKPLPLEGLYAAGASVHPGGGVPIVMQGARLAVSQMMKEMKKRG